MPKHLALIFALAIFFANGCTNWRTAPALPVRYNMVLDQLVIFSDTPLPQNHRLLQELRGLRTQVSTKLALPISDEPIHVYLFPTDDKFAAYLKLHHPSLPSRRAFFVETDTRLSVYAYWGDRVAEDLRHEVVHGYLHAVVPNLPLWFDEGLAEYFEVPRGAAGLNRGHLDQLIAEPGPFDLVRLEQLREASEMTQRDYAESWAWVHYLLESTPQHRQVLIDYLHGLGQSPPGVPISERLRRLDVHYQAGLPEHLQVMRQGLR